jgi:hypothetical protein
MKEHGLDRAMRFFFLVAATMIWAGILLTGIGAVHWVLFLPAIFFALAAITGICPGIIVSKKLFGKSTTPAEKK